MLPPLEMDLARRDQAIPGLALVLDPQALAAELRRAAPQAGLGLEKIRINYVRYQPQNYCQVHYQLNASGGTVDVGACACRPEDLAGWTRNLDGTTVSEPSTGWTCVLEESAVVVTAFPIDVKLTGLRFLQGDVERAHLLGELLPGRPNLCRTELRCLRYRPGRRYVAEWRAEDGQRLILKSYTRKSFRQGRHNATAFRSCGPLRTARLLGSSDRLGMLAFEWLPGRLLMDLVTKEDIDAKIIAMAGEALATLHSQKVEGLHEWSHETEASGLRSVALEVSSVFPNLAHRVENLAKRLCAELTDMPPLYCPIHRDFNSTQVLLCGRSIAVIDLDLACLGDPADDFGSFLAQAEHLALRGELALEKVERLRTSLIEGYCRVTRRPPPASIALNTAARLFRRARIPFRVREPEYLQRTESLLTRAEEILAQENGDAALFPGPALLQ